MTTKYEICPVEEFPPGERRIVEVNGLSIGVFNLDREYYALNNTCPHQLADLCRGRVTGTVTSPEVGEFNWERDGQVIQCPWHHWEFDITTGKSVFNPHAVRTRTYDVAVESKSDETSNSGSESTDGTDSKETRTDTENKQVEMYGTSLRGEEPPVNTYSVEVEENMVVLYV